MFQAIFKQFNPYFVYILFVAVFSWISGFLFEGLFLITFFFLIRMMVYVTRMQAWIGQGSNKTLPDVSGTCLEIAREIQISKRNLRKRTKDVQQLAKNFRNVLSFIPDALILVDGHGNIELINAKATELLSVTHRDIGLRVANLIRNPMFTQMMAQRSKEGEVIIPSTHHEGQMLKIRHIPYGIKQSMLLIADVTEQERIIQMRKDFIANASHELRTPLTVLTGYLETMESMVVEDNPMLEKPFEQMLSHSGRMRRIIEDLLQLSQLDGKKLEIAEEVDVSELAEVVVRDGKAFSDGRHEITFDIQQGLKVRGSLSELQSAYSNIVNNAIKYTPEGKKIQISLMKDVNEIRFSVRDEGMGVPKQHIPRLTQRFYRVDVDRSRETGGTGLGLAIVKHVMERHGGRLEIDSQPNIGSVFTCIVRA